MTATVLRADRDGVTELRLHRPEARNALSTQVLTELCDRLDSVHDDPAVRAVFLSGTGEVFCAGADVREFGPNPPADASLARIRLVVEVLRRIRELPQPTLAAVHGPAVGAGWGLALACDLCFATGSATFTLPEVAKGYRLPAPLVTRLAQVAGPVRAADLVYGGGTYTAGDAVAAGCVTRLSPGAEELRATAWDFCRTLAERPRRSVATATEPLRALAGAGPFPPSQLFWTEE
ncbi:MAG TPA: enoyl-CoA hydratase/isomerase family protein [Mycobacteriales bacterium]|nr:enoyl-CoA hydratase/isomerase family protein [Mycobacteriales bacterium]